MSLFTGGAPNFCAPKERYFVYFRSGWSGKKWGPDLEDISRRYRVPIVASNSFSDSEAGIFDADGSCAARLERTEGIAVARVSLGAKQPFRPVTIRHWDGEPLKMLDRLDKW